MPDQEGGLTFDHQKLIRTNTYHGAMHDGDELNPNLNSGPSWVSLLSLPICVTCVSTSWNANLASPVTPPLTPSLLNPIAQFLCPTHSSHTPLLPSALG